MPRPFPMPVDEVQESINEFMPDLEQVEDDAMPAVDLRPMKELSLMELFVRLNEVLHGSQLVINRACAPMVNEIASRLGLEPMEAFLLAPIVNEYDHDCVQMSMLARAFGCPKLKILAYHDQFVALSRKGYIVINKRDGMSVRIKAGAIKALTENHPYERPSFRVETETEFFESIDPIFEEGNASDEAMDWYDETFAELVKSNLHLEICDLISKGGFIGEHCQLPLLMAFIKELHIDDEDYVNEFDLREYFGSCNHCDIRRMASQLKSGETAAQKAGYVGVYNNSNMSMDGCWSFTPQGLDVLFHEKQTIEKVEDLIYSEDIQAHEMFYNPAEETSVHKLAEMLGNERFTDIQRRLEEKGKRKGFACLFYGAPGTGKTETVLQLAHQTGRNLVRVDVADVKSKWVGESEQNLRQVFDRYRDLCKKATEQGKPIPILLFNEADQLFGTRLKNVRTAVDKMENSMQNIILEQVENLDGILIATTNLTENFDSAFARRFIYKIRFENPTVAAREAIWRSMIPEADKAVTAQLARTYALSGGQIENIARKCSVDYVLNGERPTYEQLSRYADEELSLNRGEHRRVGFSMP